jgi:hypothetical protein
MHAVTSELDGGEWSTSNLGCFISQKEHPVPTKQEAGWAPKMICILYRKKISQPCDESKSDYLVTQPKAYTLNRLNYPGSFIK